MVAVRQLDVRGGRGARGVRASSPLPPPFTPFPPSPHTLRRPNAPIIDFSAGFHVFGAEVSDASVRFYVDDPLNTIFTRTLPPLCVTDPGFVAGGGWGRSPYAPWAPLYGILNTAMNRGDANLDWWRAHNATTLVDWVKFWELVPSTAEAVAVAVAAGAA